MAHKEDDTGLTCLYGKHKGKPAHIIGRGPSLLNVDLRKYIKQGIVIAHNDAVCAVDHIHYWLFTDKTIPERCAGYDKRVDTALVSDNIRSLVGRFSSKVILFKALSVDSLASNASPKKFIAGLFTGPAAGMWLAWKMGCNPIFMWGCDGYAFFDRSKNAVFWYGLTCPKNVPWTPEYAKEWGHGSPVPIWGDDTKLMYPKHQRYGAGFFEMYVWMRKQDPKFRIVNMNPFSIYVMPKAKRFAASG